MNRYPINGYPDPVSILQDGDAAFGVYRYDLGQWRYLRMGKNELDRNHFVRSIEEASCQRQTQ